MSSTLQPTASKATRDILPAFLRRCLHRRIMGRGRSEKLGRSASWSTKPQSYLTSLLDVTHCVTSYEPWPLRVTLRAGWAEPFEYWPAMGFTGADGTRCAIDVIYDQDLADRADMGFDKLLNEALATHEIRFVRFSEVSLMSDPKIAVARAMANYVGTSVPDEDADYLRGLLSRHGGRMTLGQLRAASDQGQLRMAQACVLAMRRTFQLEIDGRGVNQSVVRLTGKEVRK